MEQGKVYKSKSYTERFYFKILGEMCNLMRIVNCVI